MFRVAIVEDEQKSIDELNRFIDEFAESTGNAFSVESFLNPVSFLTEYDCRYDIVFMDIAMDIMNGMDCAKKLREVDDTVMLIFVTNLANLALYGYEVGAYDFIVKPLIYNDFCLKMNRAILKLINTDVLKIPVSNKNVTVMIVVSEILYIEIYGHRIVFYTLKGNIHYYGTLKKLGDLLPHDQFIRCNKSYIVNLDYVTKIEGNFVYLNDVPIAIGSKKKKDFMTAFEKYFSEKHNVHR